jgi:hypothetical protein
MVETEATEFFNCGDRASVINTYLKLLKLHEQDTTNSNLDPDRLFAMIDLDLHLQKIDDYFFPIQKQFFAIFTKNRRCDRKMQHYTGYGLQV